MYAAIYMESNELVQFCPLREAPKKTRVSEAKSEVYVI
jgi:hypothetical protein